MPKGDESTRLKKVQLARGNEVQADGGIEGGMTQQRRRANRQPLQGPPLGFLSYSRADRSYADKLRLHFEPAIRAEELTLWSDNDIAAGEIWEQKILEALDNASFALLLISPDFLASEFITKREVPLLLRAAKRRGLKLFWVLLRDCDWETAPFLKRRQAALDPERPLSRRRDKDKALVEIVREVKKGLTTQAVLSRAAAASQAIAPP